MLSQPQHETEDRNRLTKWIVELNEIEQALSSAASPSVKLAPVELKETMKKLGIVLQECEQIIEDHATGTITASDDLLQVTAGAIRASHQVVSAVVLLEAVRGMRT